jgi:cell division protein FtsQ
MTEKKENPHNEQDNANSSDIQTHLNELLSGDDGSSKTKLAKSSGKEKKLPKIWRVKANKKKTSQSDETTALATDQNINNDKIDDKNQKNSRRIEWKKLLFPHEWRAVKTIVVLLIVAVGLIYLISPASQVQKYDVVGTQELSDKAILKAAGLQKGQPLLTTLYQSDYFSQEAKSKNPQIAHLKLTLKSNNTLQIKVDEILKVGYVKAGNKYYPILENGDILNREVSDQQVGGLPLYDGFTSAKQLHKTLAEFGKLSMPLRHAVSEIVWSPNKQNNQRLLIYMNDGNEVLISANELSKKMKYYPGMVAQLDQAGQADLQVGAYFKPYK